jgi:hypothetical protein
MDDRRYVVKYSPLNGENFTIQWRIFHHPMEKISPSDGGNTTMIGGKTATGGR